MNNNKEFVARHGLIAQDDSIISGSLTVTGTINATVSGSINSASFASTASYVLPLNQNVYITGSYYQSGSMNVIGDITTTGTLTAQRINVQTVTSSILYVTGSTKFGTELTDTHQFTGSLYITGSIYSSSTISASAFSAAGITGSVQFNNNGFISGSDNFIWDSINNRLGIGTTTPSGKLGIVHNLTDTTDNIFVAESFSTATSAGNFNTAGISSWVYGKVNSGVTNAGSIRSYYSETFRNVVGLSDNGTLNFIFGARMLYGHYNTDSTATPTTNNIYGLFLYPFARTGTISNLYNLYIADAVPGGAITNHWGIFQISSTAKNYLNGSTGIGTQTISAKFQVHGIGSTSSTYTAQFHNSTGTSNSLVIRDDGNVGINTTSPNAKLDVNGNTIITGSLTVTETITAQRLNVQFITSSIAFITGSTKFGTDSSNTHQFTGSLSVTGSLTLTAISNGDGTLPVIIKNNVGTQVLAIGAAGGIIMNAGIKIKTTLGDSSILPYLELYNNGTGYTTLQSSTSYGLLLNPNGSNVGIGTINPLNKLSVASDSNLILSLGNTTDNVSGTSSVPLSRTISFLGYNNNQNAFIRSDDMSSSFVYSNLIFGVKQSGTTAIEMMRIDGATGNVGIGTSTTPDKLTIAEGDVRLEGNNTSQYYSWRYSPIHELWKIGGADGFSVYRGAVQFVTVSSAGNVGINTTNPTAKLHVDGQILANEYIVRDGGAYVGRDSDWLRIYGNAGIKLTTWNGAYLDALTVFANGNVGIGINNPSASVDIQKSSALAFRIGDGTLSYPTLLTFNSITGDLSTFSRIKSLSAQPIILSPMGTDSVIITTSGNVGIGTNNPSSKLTVSGSSNFIGNVLITGSCTITGDLIANISGSSVSSSYAATSSISLATKANSIIYSSFAGTPLSASITFDNPYPNTNYSVAITGEDARIWTIQNKTAAGFIINSNSNESLVGYTDWIATSFN